MTPLVEIKDGAWTARWGDWMIFLKFKANGWAVVVWTLPPGVSMRDREQIGAATGFDTPADAAAFACGILQRKGVQVLINGQKQALVKFLAFSPAPQGVA